VVVVVVLVVVILVVLVGVMGLVVGIVVGIVVGPPPVVVLVPFEGLPGRPGMPRHAPNSLWQPGPQNSIEEPHQKCWEQQGPKLGLPMHMVLLPHRPSVVICRSPVGIGMVDVLVLLVVVVVVAGVVGVVVVLVLMLVLVLVGVVDVELVVGCGATRGHPQVPY
jgi:hypothetical protein